MKFKKKKLTQREIKPALVAESIKSAESVGLGYVTDSGPGIRRKRVGKGFGYIGANGKPVRNRQALRRFKTLAIPPAWIDVWICANPNGHIQVTARDAKGRKQYRYHRRWRTARAETKYNKMIAFGKALPLIRKQVERDVSLRGLPRAKVLATIVRLLETTCIRVGNEEYARANDSFGLTTMRDWHVEVSGSNLRFRFRGKNGKDRAIDITDSRLARVVKSCQEIPGYDLFQYIDEYGQYRTVNSTDVNAYLREITGQEFTAKDFRTWAGTVLAVLTLYESGECDSDTKSKKNVSRAIKTVAEQLGNTPTVCREYYVHPGVIDAYLNGSLPEVVQRRAEKIPKNSRHKVNPKEANIVPLLKKCLTQG
jgi:DNA topoisomerase-1